MHNVSKGQLADRIFKSWKAAFTIIGSSNIQLLKFRLFNFGLSTFKQILLRILWKNFQVSKYILNVLTKFYRFTNIHDLRFFDNETTALRIFFLNFARKSILLLKFCQMRVMLLKFCQNSILLVLLKCIVVGYSNGYESFTGRPFSNYRLLNKLFHFFQYLIYSVFHDTFVKSFIEKLSFLSSNSKNQFQDVVCYRKLGCLTLWYWNGNPLNIR